MFLLDTNVFINAARDYYHPDVAPTFWDWIATEHTKGNLASIDAVRKELNDGDGKKDQGFLHKWSAQLPASFWIKPDHNTASSMYALSTWATNKQPAYKSSAIEGFFQAADYYLVAQAHSGQHHTITFEVSAPKAIRRVPIPDACIALQVPYSEPFKVFRKLGLRFR